MRMVRPINLDASDSEGSEESDGGSSTESIESSDSQELSPPVSSGGAMVFAEPDNYSRGSGESSSRKRLNGTREDGSTGKRLRSSGSQEPVPEPPPIDRRPIPASCWLEPYDLRVTDCIPTAASDRGTLLSESGEVTVAPTQPASGAVMSTVATPVSDEEPTQSYSGVVQSASRFRSGRAHGRAARGRSSAATVGRERTVVASSNDSAQRLGRRASYLTPDDFRATGATRGDSAQQSDDAVVAKREPSSSSTGESSARPIAFRARHLEPYDLLPSSHSASIAVDVAPLVIEQDIAEGEAAVLASLVSVMEPGSDLPDSAEHIVDTDALLSELEGPYVPEDCRVIPFSPTRDRWEESLGMSLRSRVVTKKTGGKAPRRVPESPPVGSSSPFTSSVTQSVPSLVVPAATSVAAAVAVTVAPVPIPSCITPATSGVTASSGVATCSENSVPLSEPLLRCRLSIRGPEHPCPARSPRCVPSGFPSIKGEPGPAQSRGNVPPLGSSGSRNLIGSPRSVMLFCELDLLSFGECAAIRAMGLIGIQRLGRREMAFLLANQDRWPRSARRSFPVDASALYRYWREALMARSGQVDRNREIDDSMRALQQQRIVAMLSYLQVLERALEE